MKASDYTHPLLPFWYTNWRDERALRRVVNPVLRFGPTERYPEPAWHIFGYCLDRQAMRHFQLSRMETKL